MKRGRERSAEVARRRSDDSARLAAKAQAPRPTTRANVNAALLRPTKSYGMPEFVSRGHYVDLPFACKDCGKQEVWTATQQKWWYETAKGDVWTTARRCRACRRREQARRTQARQVHLEGLARRHKP